MAVTPDGQRVVSGAADGTVRVWNLASGLLERTRVLDGLTPEEGAGLDSASAAPSACSIR